MKKENKKSKKVWHCKECGGINKRYLNCDECREKRKTCIDVCCDCGAEA